jgi:hypothetical protein
MKRCVTRVDLTDKGLVEVMHAEGCRNIQFGLEAASQRALDSIGKSITTAGQGCCCPSPCCRNLRRGRDTGIELIMRALTSRHVSREKI